MKRKKPKRRPEMKMVEQFRKKNVMQKEGRIWEESEKKKL